ncbi:hypothetical protein ACXET9_07360 [Brachybacterium sp. DNPG3]
MGEVPWAAVIIALGGGGGVAAIITSVASWRRGVREQDVAEDQTALDGYKSLAAELRQDLRQYKADLAALREEMSAKDRETDARFERIEAELSTERSTRWAAVQYARDLVALIRRALPSIQIPAPPDSISEHIIVPPREEP